MATDLTGQQVGAADTYYDAVLKIDYLPVIKEQFPQKSVLLMNVQKSTKGMDTSGRFLEGTVSKAFTTGIGARPEGNVLPTTGYEDLATFKVYMKYNYARIEVSGPVIRASRDNRGALAKAFTRETQSATKGMRNDVNRQLFGNGTGILCMTNGSASSTTLTVDSLFGLGYTSPSTATSPLAAVKYLKKKMYIDVGDATTYTTLDVTNKQISTVDSATQATLVANSSTWDDNGFIIRRLAAAAEIMGLRGIVDDNSTGGLDALQGITRSTTGNDYWNASVVDTGSVTAPTSITEDLLQDAMTASEQNDGEVGLFVTTFGVRDSYGALLVGDKRFTNTLDLKGGFKGLTYNDIGFVADKDAPPYFVFGLDMSTLYNAESLPVGWMDDDGSVLSRVVNYDSFEATLRLYSNFFTDRPVSNVSLSFVQ